MNDELRFFVESSIATFVALTVYGLLFRFLGTM